MIYVDYIAGTGRIPWDANHTTKGMFVGLAWTANRIANLNPETAIFRSGASTRVTPRRALHVHSVIETPDGWYGLSKTRSAS